MENSRCSSLFLIDDVGRVTVCDEFDEAILIFGRLRLGNAPSFNTFRE